MPKRNLNRVPAERRDVPFTLDQIKNFSEQRGYDIRSSLKFLISYSKYEGETKSIRAYEEMLKDL